ncbi:MAG: SDR family NAD(P)-dependent oxidoreductase, partial [Gammaproteobacteria bacterium]
MKFDNINAIVSGGVSGLGFWTCERIVKAGGKVAMLDVNEKLGAEVAGKLGARARFIKTDVSSEHEVTAAVAQAEGAFGSVQLVVNCAGVLGAGRTLGREGPMQTDFFAKVIHINLIGTFNLIKA